MNPSDALHELLYVSTLAPGAAISVVADIAREARRKNKPLDITGVLVFDGQRFCQHLEGTMRRVVNLFDRICEDTRHVDVRLLHEAPLENKKFLQFSMGFADVIDVDVLGQLEQLTGAEAVAAFSAMHAKLEFLH